MFASTVVEREYKPCALIEIIGDGRKMQLGTFETVEAAVDMLFYRPVVSFVIEADADNSDCFDGIVTREGGHVFQFAIEPTKW